ncbi:MAG: GNAT family N-acetyltransferase [Pseudomonadota bacterium]|jgi:ribosomal protein S18 acetylase RimI-like enzyme
MRPQIMGDIGWRLAEGYRPGLLGTCVRLHADFYSRQAGFGAFFEGQVAVGMAEFLRRLDRPRNGIWSAFAGGRMLGCIAMDGEDLGRNAGHLRWFIVDGACRGLGIGKALLATALRFADTAGFEEVELWTFSGLDAARHLYERAGFRLVEEATGNRWGAQVREQRFIRPRHGLQPPAVLGERELVFPGDPGNGPCNSLGNIRSDPHIGTEAGAGAGKPRAPGADAPAAACARRP